MNRPKRLEGRATLARIGEAHLAADRSQLFRTGDELSHIRHDFMRFKDLGEGRPEMARRLVRKIERAEETLAEEHGDVGTANRYEWRARRGLIGVCALFGVQLANLATQLLIPDATAGMPEFLGGYAHRALAAALLALAAFPVRDFIFAYRFGKAKELGEGALAEAKKELLSSLGSERMRESRKKEEA